jgi:hypothetical protein
MKSLLVGTGCYLCKMYNYHDSRACGYMRSRILSRLDGFGYGDGFSVALWNRVILCAPLWIILGDIF